MDGIADCEEGHGIDLLDGRIDSHSYGTDRDDETEWQAEIRDPFMVFYLPSYLARSIPIKILLKPLENSVPIMFHIVSENVDLQIPK